MTIDRYSVPGFKPTTFGTWVSSHNHKTRAPALILYIRWPFYQTLLGDMLMIRESKNDMWRVNKDACVSLDVLIQLYRRRKILLPKSIVSSERKFITYGEKLISQRPWIDPLFRHGFESLSTHKSFSVNYASKTLAKRVLHLSLAIISNLVEGVT